MIVVQPATVIQVAISLTPHLSEKCSYGEHTDLVRASVEEATRLIKLSVEAAAKLSEELSETNAPAPGSGLIVAQFGSVPQAGPS